MNKLNIKNTMLNPVFSDIQLERNNSTLMSFLKENQKPLLNLAAYLGKLCLILTAVTGLLLLWFEFKN